MRLLKSRAFLTLVFCFLLTGCSLLKLPLTMLPGGPPPSLFADAGVAIQTGLGAIQDAERNLCNASVPAPLPIPECTPVASALGLGTGTHRQISDTLDRAFGLQKELAVALRTGAPAAPVLARLAPLVAVLRLQTVGLVIGPETFRLRTALAGFEATLAKLQNPGGAE